MNSAYLLPELGHDIESEGRRPYKLLHIPALKTCGAGIQIIHNVKEEYDGKKQDKNGIKRLLPLLLLGHFPSGR